MILELEHDDEALVAASPELQTAIRRAVQMTIRNARANPAPAILPSNTLNGALASDATPERARPELDAVQTMLQQHRHDDKDLYSQFKTRTEGK